MHVGPVGSVHNKAREAATNLMNQATYIEMAVSKHSDQAHKAYRTCLNASIKCTKFLLRQGLAFRGHDESATSSNRGNYLELLQFLANNDDKVREVVMENTPRNLKLLAPSIQTEIVNSCALETLDAIMDDLKDRFFLILVDEARDVSVKEQMAMVLRYVDDNGHVIERFVGIQHVTNITSSSLKDVIGTFFSRNGLSISKLRGQGYDGASNMRGRSRRNAPIRTNRHHYRVELFIYVIDEQITELDDHFNEVNTELLICLVCLSSKDSFVAFDKPKLRRLAQFYPQDFSDEDRLALEDQLDIYIHYVCSSSDFSQLEGIGDLAKKMVNTRMHQVFNYVYLLITLSLVLPVATASVERAFSVMNIVKGPLRNKMGDQWLSDSLLVYIERDIFACIENEAIMLRFQNMKHRHEQL
ncbi:unnamed protein product [Malus baccata var. baccata]